MRPALLFETRRFMVIDKPAGLAVHPGPNTAYSLEQYLPELVLPRRPVPIAVHRLDRDTSGCLLLARDAAANRRLSADFAEGRMEKIYRAILRNPPTGDAGKVDAPLAKISSAADGWRMQVSPDGKAAHTGWRVLARSSDLALAEFRPTTGRTHQLRVHATLLAPGCTILGDPVYGQRHATGMMLHAWQLSVTDYWAEGGDSRITAEAPCPDRFSALGLGWSA